jgi:soluble lytic murein transglycosylase
MGIIRTESSFRADVVSDSGAVGLMQLLPSTARSIAPEIGLDDYSDRLLETPVINIELGAYYISYLIGKFSSVDTAAAAYNAGEGNVAKWLANPDYSPDGRTLKKIPYKETADYVEKVRHAETAYRVYHKL